MKGPFSTVKPRKGGMLPDSDKERTRLEELEHQEATEKQAISKATLDKVAAFLDDPVFVSEHTWPFLNRVERGMAVQHSVSQYFLHQKLVIDKFYTDEKFSQELVDWKRKQLNAHGFKYAYLRSTSKLVDIAVQLEGQL